MKQTLFVALGANLDNPKQKITDAIKCISQLDNFLLIKSSSLYLSAPMGPQDQSPFINAVVKLSTTDSPIDCLDKMQAIEADFGRIRKKQRWGPRTLDLDLLLYNEQIIDTDRLTIPHYGMQQRSFVIIPLAEIEPKLILPNGRSIAELSRLLGEQGIKKL